MSWIEVEAFCENGTRPKTKKQLKEDVAAGKRIDLISVSPFNNFAGATPDLQPGTRLTLAGPNPWSDRRWYAQILVNKDGKVVVK